MKKRLENEENLQGKLDKILDKLTETFDMTTKKLFDGTAGESFDVPGLREDRERGFEENLINLSR